MVAGMRSYLFAAGVDVIAEIAKGSLVLSSDQGHMIDGRFDPDAMLRLLEENLDRAKQDGFEGLWASGDMSWELGADKDVKKLLEYEWKLEKYFETHPGIYGICQYHADILPRDMVCHGLLIHPTLFINETLSRANPQFIESDRPLEPVSPTPHVKHTVHNLCLLQPEEEGQ
jgi:hypothetical protein